MANNQAAYLRDGEKRCTVCDQTKLLKEFRLSYQGKHGPVYASRCNRCNADDSYLRMRRSVFEKKYGITLEDYEEMHNRQGGVCAICDKPEQVIQNSKLRLLSVDHDHLTGKVRGLLCSNCNRAIGLLNDDADVLKRAIRYLQSGVDYN